MLTSGPNVEKSLSRNLLVGVLVLSMFLVYTFGATLGALLVDIAKSFNVSVGTASQLATVARFASIVIGVAMSALVFRFKLKSLFILGVIFYGVGAIGGSFAPNFLSMLICTGLIGMGQTVVVILAITLLGESLPLVERGFAIGLVLSGESLAQIFVPSISASIANIASWRSVLQWFILPVSLVCLVLTWLVMPSSKSQKEFSAKSQYRAAFKQILTSKSAIACVVGFALFYVGALVPVYAPSFYRITFNESRSVAAFFQGIAAVGAMCGVLIGGRLINEIGRKTLTVVAVFISSVFTLIFTYMPNVWISIAFWVISALLWCIGFAGISSLVLEQVPGFRGSMMSINQIFGNIGLILGIQVCNVLLNMYANNFHFVMILIAATGIAGSTVLMLLSRDPTKTTQKIRQ